MNSFTPQQRSIDGQEFKVTPLGGLSARSVNVRMVRLLGPLLVKGRDGVTDLFQNLTEMDVEYLCDVFMPKTMMRSNEGKWVQLDSGIFDIIFGQKQLTMWKWLKFCLEVNFPDFLALAKGKLGDLGDLGEKEEKPSS